VLILAKLIPRYTFGVQLGFTLQLSDLTLFGADAKSSQKNAGLCQELNLPFIYCQNPAVSVI